MNALLHLLKFTVGVDKPYSQVSTAELQLLEKLVRDHATVVELGCYEGKTTAALAKNSSGIVYSVDPFFKGRLGICYGEIIAKMHCSRSRAKNVRFIKKLSFDAAKSFDKKIDFLFVDADHRYESICQDWQDWFCKVKKGGIIALHDCKQVPNSPNYLGSMRFYEQNIPNIKEVKEIAAVDSLVAFQVLD